MEHFSVEKVFLRRYQIAAGLFFHLLSLFTSIHSCEITFIKLFFDKSLCITL